MENVVTNELMRKLDRHMIEDIGIPGAVLMENAARDIADAVLRCKRQGRVVILTGPGNNGGDGFALLRILTAHSRDAVVVMLAEPGKLTGDAKLNYDVAMRLGLNVTSDLNSIKTADVIVDALFGTGLCRPIEGIFAEAIALANSANAYRIAIDVPSGINGTSGKSYGVVFRADETVTMLALKRGLIITDMPENVGRITVSRIGIVGETHKKELENEQLIDEGFVRSLLPNRRRVSNKGSYGKALVIAGSRDMPGAAVMASTACVRCGAGLTKAFIPREIIPQFACLPEAMLAVDEGDASLIKAIEWADAIGFGCGSGNDENRYAKLRRVLRCGKPAVIDADGLNAMDEETLALLNDNHILTPHPGEMSRLTGYSITEILDSPVEIAQRFAVTHGCTLVLKNAATVIASPDGRVRYNTAGNAGLAKGGSGDVLCGIITAMLAQGLEPFDAASVGCFLLGSSADAALHMLNERIVTATDAAAFAELIIDSFRAN